MSLSQMKDELAEAREICRSNLVKQVMMDNQIATSFGLRLCLSTEMPLIAKRAGYSAVLMNLEHAPIGIQTMRDISVACLNVGSIAAVPGVDALFVGCADLTTDLGIAGQYDADEFAQAIDAISTAARNVSVSGRKVFVGLGGLEGRPDLLEGFARRYSNIRFTMAGRDLSVLAAGMSRQLKSIRDIFSRIQGSEVQSVKTT
ncbi:HpcH/HpaI aldolase [Fusarium acuminatum]|uniref:HpcH/HpaI aldolase n=1 Tax=Fusarium acuminatum TaxID=5515 RepID=A0ABZ2XCG3_9HYPO